jgi:hypothetical protein
MAGRAVGKRTDASTETVAAWKRTKSQAAPRKLVDKVKPEIAVRAAKFEATEGDLGIDVGAEPSMQIRRPTQQAPKPTATTPVPEQEGDYTSRLLAAKRRARGDDPDASSAPADKN